jgi:hypothetical protein
MKSTQSDRGLEFDGVGSGPAKGSNRFAHNKWSGHSNDGREVNFGRGPTVAGRTGHKTPGSVGSVPAMPAQGSVRDNINRGSQVRNPGGTRAWDPSATQNYKGNPDQIRAKQSGGPDYGAVTKGSRPDVASGRSNFNYGPKSQY